jgi:hypothetical protein
MALFGNKDTSGTGKISASEIQEKYRKSNYALMKEQWNYVLNRAFLYNEQWVNFDRIRQTVAAIPREPDRLRVTFNQLWPASRHLMAKLLSRPLVFEVAPSEPDDGSVRGAHVAESVLMDLHRSHDWEEAREHIAWSTWLGGTAVMALDWDQTAGTTVGQRKDGSDIGTGEICETALSVLEVGWEPGARSAERGLWWVRAQVLPPSEVKDKYGMKNIPKSDATSAVGFMGRTLSIEDLGRPNPELTLCLTYYERPNKARPDGVVCTVVGNEIVDGPHPWPFPFKDRLNMVVFRETKVTGKAHGETVFSAAVPIQVALNQSLSNILEHLKLTGNSRLLVPDTFDGLDELSDLPGEVLQYNMAGGKPEWMTPGPMANWVMESPEMLMKQLEDVLGLHEISRGVAPANIESGVGLSILVEQDTTPLGAITRELAHGFERFACMVLETYAANVKDTRKSRIQRRGATPEIVEWNGPSLAGQTIASVPMDAVMPRSRAALLTFAKDLWDRKIIQDPQMFTKMADIPSQEDLLDGIDTDVAKAQRENRDFAVGRPVVPRPFDNHAKHIARHNDFRKTLRYESMPVEWQNFCDQHLQAHERMAAEQMGNQVAKTNIDPNLAAVPTADMEAPLPAGIVSGMNMWNGAPGVDLTGGSRPDWKGTATSGRPAQAPAGPGAMAPGPGESPS